MHWKLQSYYTVKAPGGYLEYVLLHTRLPLPWCNYPDPWKNEWNRYDWKVAIPQWSYEEKQHEQS